MLQDIPTPTSTLHEARPFVLETERLLLRRPTLADVKAITALINDLRVSINLRRVPHPYFEEHAIEFIRAMADEPRNTSFLIECESAAVGVVGVDWSEPRRTRARLLARRRPLGQGFWHRGRARGDRFHLRGIRDRAPLRRRARDQSVVAQHPGEMRLPVERRRTAPLRGAGLVDPGRPLQAEPRRVGVAEELGRFDETGAVPVVPAKAGPYPGSDWVQRLHFTAHGDDASRVDYLGASSHRRTHLRLPAPQLLLADENIKPRGDDDRRTHDRRHRRHVAEHDVAEYHRPHDHQILIRHHHAGRRQFQRAVDAEQRHDRDASRQHEQAEIRQSRRRATQTARAPGRR